MSNKSMKLEQAMFILRHGSAEGEHKYFEAISVIEKAYNRLKAENRNCGVKIQNQREQLKACNEKIKEQQAEIERLKNSGIRANSVEDWLKHCNELRAEAVKEFAERVKERLKEVPRYDVEDKAYYAIGTHGELVDDLLQEMGCGE